MSDDDGGNLFFGDLFGDDVPAAAAAAGMNAPPAAPMLLGPNGARFVVPNHLKQSIVIGSGRDAPMQELDGGQTTHNRSNATCGSCVSTCLHGAKG